jgi:hypothetical protein
VNLHPFLRLRVGIYGTVRKLKMQRFKKLRPINMTECKTDAYISDALNRWKTGDCPLMIGHPASMGYGFS